MFAVMDVYRVLAVDKACSSVQATHERCLVTNIVPTVVECAAHTKPAHHQQVVQLQWDLVATSVVEGLLRHDRYVHVFDITKQVEVLDEVPLWVAPRKAHRGSFKCTRNLDS